VAATIRTDTEGSIRILTIANPERRNAFTGDMARSLLEALDRAEADRAVRCVVVAGDGSAGPAFSSGHDLGEVRARPETASDPAANAAFVRPASMTVPVIAAVDGPAYAAGFILAINCDLRVATPEAAFCASGARIGLLPVGGQLSRLLALVAYPVALELVATAAPMDGHRAVAVGLANRLAPSGRALEAALALARQVAAVSPAVVRSAKVGLQTTLRSGLDAGLAFEQAQAARLRHLGDGEEGVRAFVERRAPRFADPPADLVP
jgi:enoyl-CoA hydratase/carnithine racemase